MHAYCNFLLLTFSLKILGELYVDREYLSNLIKDPGGKAPLSVDYLLLWWL